MLWGTDTCRLSFVQHFFPEAVPLSRTSKPIYTSILSAASRAQQEDCVMPHPSLSVHQTFPAPCCIHTHNTAPIMKPLKTDFTYCLSTVWQSRRRGNCKALVLERKEKIKEAKEAEVRDLVLCVYKDSIQHNVYKPLHELQEQLVRGKGVLEVW